jgi:thioredoxin 1
MILQAEQSTFSQDIFGSSTPVLINFWAPWCGVCRLVTPALTDLKRKQGDDLKVITLNADEHLKLATLYRLKTLPTLILMDQGEVIERFEQFRDRHDIRLTIDAIQSHLQRLDVRQNCSVY